MYAVGIFVQVAMMTIGKPPFEISFIFQFAAATFVLAAVLALISYFFVERPMMRLFRKILLPEAAKQPQTKAKAA